MKALAALESDATLLMEGGITATIIAFLQTAVLRMIPYSVPALFLIALDCLYGIKAAKYRGEKVRLSTAVRKTVTKVFMYLCWIVLASTLALSFHKDWLEWFVLGLVYANEFASIVGNYLETKGIEFSFVGLYRWALRVITGKVGEAMDTAEAEDIIKPKPRDAKGRFVKRTK